MDTLDGCTTTATQDEELLRLLVEVLATPTVSLRAGVRREPHAEARALLTTAGSTCAGADLPGAALALARRRAAGTPMAHLVGEETFLGHQYAVVPGVLVPHPATEALAVVAGDRLRRSGGTRLFEVGVGSGQVSIELLRDHQQVEAVGSDVDPQALALTRRNAVRHLGGDAERLTLVTADDPADVLGAFEGHDRADLLVSNPPYLSEIDPISDEVRSSTDVLALYGPNEDPNHFFRVLAEQGRHVLRPGGAMVLECHAFHAKQVLRILGRQQWAVELLDRDDCEGLPGSERMRPMDATGHCVVVAEPRD